MMSNKVFICIFCFFLMGILYALMQMLLPKLQYTDLMDAEFSSQTTMESMGPLRPNIINRWTKFQAQEHPEQYDMDDGIVIAQDEKKEKKKNLRQRTGEHLYQDSIVVDVGTRKEDKNEKKRTQTSNKEYYPHVRVDLYLESLNPDTYRFVKGPLSKVAHDPAIMEFTDLRIYMFGKGRQISVDPQQFECENGPIACYGNLVDSCFVKYTTSGDTVDAMVCLYEKHSFDDRSIATCIKGLEEQRTTKKNIMNCIKSEGKYLLQKAYDKTPRNLTVVPSMRINKGKVVPASSNLKDILCQTWTGEKPQSCT